jgi:hypothetical protein
VLHEVLHTLGLGENPPASTAITHRILSLCDGREGDKTQSGGKDGPATVEVDQTIDTERYNTYFKIA